MGDPIKIPFEQVVSDIFGQLDIGHGILCMGIGKREFDKLFDKLIKQQPQRGDNPKLIPREGSNGDFFVTTEAQKGQEIIPFYLLRFTAQKGYAYMEIIY